MENKPILKLSNGKHLEFESDKESNFNGVRWIHICFDPDPDPEKNQFEVTTPFYIGDPNLFGNLPIPSFYEYFLTDKEYRKLKLKKLI